MRAVVRLFALLLGLSALLSYSTEAQGRRRPRARPAASAAETTLDFDDQPVRGAVPTPRFDANTLFGSNNAGNVGRARRALGLVARGDRAGALQVLQGVDPAVESVEVAYVIAWVRFANGDFDGAARALGPTLRRARVAQHDTLRTELAIMNTYGDGAIEELGAQLGDDRAVLAVAERMVDRLLAHGELERAYEVLTWIESRVRGRQLATALDREASIDFARGSPNVAAIRLAEAVAIARSLGDASLLEPMRARVLEGAQRADRAWAESRDSRSRIAATILYRVWLRSGTGPQAAAIESTVSALERAPSPEPTGGVAVGPLRGALDLRLGDVRGCYERALVTNPSLRGRVVLRFTVTPTGDVTSPSAEATGNGLEAVATCVAERAETWRVPAGARSAFLVTYPFVLTPGGA